MRVLLDECIDKGLRHSFVGHDCHTCRYAGLKGLTNGVLLAAAEDAGFELLVTVDQNIPYQQNLAGRPISLVVLQSRTTNLDDLLVLMPDVLRAFDTLKPWRCGSHQYLLTRKTTGGKTAGAPLRSGRSEARARR